MQRLVRDVSLADARGYLAGVALAAPFIANLLPWGSWALAVVAPLALHVAWYGFRALRVTPLMMVAGAIAAEHLLHLLTTPTPFYRDVLRDVVTTGAACAIWISVKSEHRTGAIEGFFDTVVVVAMLATVLGLGKYVLLTQGIVIPWLIDKCGVNYPQGAALCGDYALFGLLLMAGAIGIVRNAMYEPLGLVPVTALALIMAAIALSGSRRGMALAPIIPAYWLLLSWRTRTVLRALPAIVLITGVGVSAALPIAPYVYLRNAPTIPTTEPLNADDIVTSRTGPSRL